MNKTNFHPGGRRKQYLSVLCGVFCLLFAFLALTACGGSGVHWLPPYKRLPTTPDPFSFTTKTGVALNTSVTSDAITVTGLTGDSSPISITGSVGSASKYAIGSATATDAAGTVKNGDQVTVTHTSANALGSSTVSTLSIGNVNGTFTSITETLQPLSFSTNVQSGGFIQTFATIVSVDSTLTPHTISIKDSIGSSSAQFALADANGIFSTNFINTPLTVVVLNNLRIYVRNLPSATSVVTTLTVDGTPFTVNLSHL
jgi:hypothetical protein